MVIVGIRPSLCAVVPVRHCYREGARFPSRSHSCRSVFVAGGSTSLAEVYRSNTAAVSIHHRLVEATFVCRSVTSTLTSVEYISDAAAAAADDAARTQVAKAASRPLHTTGPPDLHLDPDPTGYLGRIRDSIRSDQDFGCKIFPTHDNEHNS